ncbi:hypothetical protein [Ideonella sp.]|uniref:hypothetical protein n=1 Tax=Ideonella sp. TaxID=1929293 RepID=UPI0035B2444E
MSVSLNRRQTLGALALAAAGTWPGPARAGSPPRYRIEDLGDLGGPAVRPRALNLHGIATGEALKNDRDANGVAFRGPAGALVDQPWTGVAHRGNGINDDGLVVGDDQPDHPGTYACWMWDGMQRRDLQVRGAPHLRSARDISQRREVVGLTIDAQLYLYADGAVRLHEPPARASFWDALCINGSGTVGGMLYRTGRHLVTAGFVMEHGVVRVLDLPGTTDHGVRGINDAGHVCGFLRAVPRGPDIPFLLREGELITLGRLPGTTSSTVATALNRHDMVVGQGMWSQSPGSFRWLAFLWVDGRMHELNTLADAQAQGWTLRTAEDINDVGQILGTGLHHGVRRAYLATPI